MKYMKGILTVWGGICLFCALICLYGMLFLDPGSELYLLLSYSSTSLGQWLGMGLLSLGLARVIGLLEKK